MQPIIDIIHELSEKYIDEYLAAHPPDNRFVDRGDPAVADWSKLTLTGDSAWHDLDLSSIVPIGTNFVLLRVAMDADNVDKKLSFRKKGHTGEVNIAECRVVVIDLPHHYGKTVAVSADRIIQYRLSTVVWRELLITVAGWYVGNYSAKGYEWRGNTVGADFFGSMVTFDGAWHELDLSGIVPEYAKCVNMYTRVKNDSVGLNVRFKYRRGGSTTTLYTCMLRPQVAGIWVGGMYPVACSEGRKIEYCFDGADNPGGFIAVRGWWF